MSLWCTLFRVSIFLLILCLTGNLFLREKLSCDQSLSNGTWGREKRFVPSSCYIQDYYGNAMKSCLNGKTIVFRGDSIARSLFTSLRIQTGFTARHQFLEKFYDDRYDIHNDKFDLVFIWDPFLNQTLDRSAFQDPNVFTIVSSGLWYLKHNISVKRLEESMSRALWEQSQLKMTTFVRFLSPLEEWKLDHHRKMFLNNRDIDSVNGFLKSMQNDTQNSFLPLVPNSFLSLYETVPPNSTLDGLHYEYDVVKNEINLFMNALCHSSSLSIMCCSPSLSLTPFKLMAFLGAVILYILYRFAMGSMDPKLDLYNFASVVGSMLLILMYCIICDRTDTFMKMNKEFSWPVFGFFLIVSLALGLLTLEDTGNDSFLNRDQTDEWKGWMQLVILFYHYFGASKVFVIYKCVRVLVASYLFMTGYGHCTFYLKKKDFGLKRVVGVLIRLNLLTVLLSYTMEQPIPFYYFGPLVSFWFLMIYAVMRFGSNLDSFLVLKVIVCMTMTTLVLQNESIISGFFGMLSLFFKTDSWDAREATFRLRLDSFIVYIGMLCGWMSFHRTKMDGILTFKKKNLPSVKLLGLGLACTTILGFLFYDFSGDKFAYNILHPVLSIAPVLSFIVIRNSTSTARRYSSKFFRWIGKMSLETFLLQYHIWLAVDTKGLLFILPLQGVQPYSVEYWLNFALVSILFLGISEILCDASNYFQRKMQSDDVIWKTIAHGFCSYKVKTETQNFCRNEYNLTGLCSKQSCPLANGRYATIREIDGILYLFVKTVERSHSPAKLWEKIKLSKNYSKALEQISNELLYWPEFIIHKCKQRLTKITQYLNRMRKMKLKGGPKLIGIKKKIESREARKEAKAESAARLEINIEQELLNRLRSGVYGDSQIVNESQEAFKNVLDEIEYEQEGEELFREYVSDFSAEESDMEDFSTFASDDEDVSSDFDEKSKPSLFKRAKVEIEYEQDVHEMKQNSI